MITECAVCQKHVESSSTLPGGVLYKDDQVFIAHYPVLEDSPLPYYGHVIIEMSRHITRPAAMTDEEAQSVGLWLKRISLALEKTLGAEHVYISRIGDKTAHLHFHVMPRYPQTPKEFWGIDMVNQWKDCPRANPDEIRTISNDLRQFLAQI